MTGYRITQVDAHDFRARLLSAAAPARQEGQAKGYRASSLAGCLRTVGYRLLGIAPTDETFNPDYELAAAQGNIIHHHLQRYALAAGDLIYEYPGFGPAIELPLARCTLPAREAQRQALDFSGHIDGVVRMKNGALAIWDIKTVAAKDMAPGKWADVKLQKYAVQLNAYLHFFATPDGEQARRAFVYRVSRDNTADVALFGMLYQPELAEAELARVAAAKACTDVGALPEPEPERGPCVFCDWRSLCPAGTVRR